MLGSTIVTYLHALRPRTRGPELKPLGFTSSTLLGTFFYYFEIVRTIPYLPKNAAFDFLLRRFLSLVNALTLEQIE